MIVLAVDVEKRLGALQLAVRFKAAGGATALFGPSGAGKTSVVNMIAGLLTPDRGFITLDDTILFEADKRIDVPPHRRRIGYVFQEGRLFPHFTAKSRLRAAHERATARRDRIRAHRGLARHYASASPPAAHAFGRRTPACRHWPRLADAAAAFAAR